MKTVIIHSAVLALFAPAAGGQQTRHVPLEYPTIQEAVDASSDGDVVMIAAGLYVEQPRLQEKAVSLIGTGEATTILRAPSTGPDYVIDVSVSSSLSFTIEQLSIRDSRGSALAVTGSDGLVVRDVTIENCEQTFGAALVTGSGSPLFERVTFRNNTAFNGGAINTTSGFSGEFRECMFDGNSASNAGAAVIDYQGSTTLFINCTFTNHTAGNAVIFAWVNSVTSLQGCTFCGNSIPAWASGAGGSIIDLGGNVITDECAAADCDADGISDADEIAAGAADLNGNGIPDTCECIADVNQDGIVNGADISAVLGFWGQAGKPLPAADITRDGLVDGADIAVLLGNWGECP